MRNQSFLFLTSGLLLGTTALTGAAFAQKGINLAPKTQWSVSKVNGGTPQAYCAIARRFEKNLIMTVARNKKNENSIALDFQNGNFDTGKQYNVFLDPGAGQQRQFSIRPTSPKAFVFKIGSDRPFLNALDRTGFMRVEIGDEVFNLNLSDIEKGQSELDGCIASDMMPAAGDSMMPSPTRQAENPSHEFEAKLQALKVENEKLQSRITALQQSSRAGVQPASGDIAMLREKNAELQQENQRLQKAVRDSNATVKAEQGEAVASLARENQRLQKMLDEMGKENASAKEASVLSARLSALEEENLELTRRLNDTGQSVATIKNLKEKIARLQSEKSNMQLALDSSVNQASVNALENEIRLLEAENKKLSERVVSLREEKERAFKQVSFYETENGVLKEKLGTQQSSASRLTQVDDALLQQLREEIVAIERRSAAEIEEKEKRIGALEAQIRGLKTSEARLRGKNDALQRLAERTVSAPAETSEIEELIAENEALQSDLKTLRAEYETAKTLHADVESIQSEKEQIQGQLYSALQHIGELEGALSVAENKVPVIDNESTLAIIQGENERLEEQLAAYQEKVETGQNEIASLKLKLEQIEAEQNLAMVGEVETLKRHKSILKEDLEIERRNSDALEQEILALQEQLSQTELDVLAAQTSLQEREAELSGLQITRADIEGGNEELETLKHLLKKAEEKVAFFEGEIGDASQKIESLELALEGSTAENEQLSFEFAQLEETHDKTKSEMERLILDRASLLNSIETASGDHQDNIQELERKIAELEERNAEIQNFLEQQDAESQSEIKELRARIDTLTKEKADMELALANADVFNKSLQSRNEEAFARIENMEEEILEYRDMQAQYETFEEQILSLKEEKENLQGQMEEKLSEKQKLLSNADMRMTALVDDKQSMQREMEQMRQQIKLQQDRFLRNVGLQVQNKRQNANDAPRIAEAVVKPSQPQTPQAMKPVEKISKTPIDVDENIETAYAKTGISGNTDQREEITTLAEIEPASGDNVSAGDEEVVSAPPAAKDKADNIVGSAQDEQAELFPETARASTANAAQAQEEMMKRQMNSDRSRLSEKAALERNEVEFKDVIARQTTVVTEISQRAENAQSEAQGLGVEKMPESSLEFGKKKTDPRQAEVITPPQPTLKEAINVEQTSVLSIQDILTLSNVSLSSPVSAVEKSLGHDVSAYQWQGDNVFGSAMQRPLETVGQFDVYVREYLEKTQSRCEGDFAITPTGSQETGQTRIDSYDIACVGDNIDSAASLVFFNKEGVFTAMAHESSVAQMGIAMDMRDRLVDTIKKAQI